MVGMWSQDCHRCFGYQDVWPEGILSQSIEGQHVGCGRHLCLLACSLAKSVCLDSMGPANVFVGCNALETGILFPSTNFPLSQISLKKLWAFEERMGVLVWVLIWFVASRAGDSSPSVWLFVYFRETGFCGTCLGWHWNRLLFGGTNAMVVSNSSDVRPLLLFLCNKCVCLCAMISSSIHIFSYIRVHVSKTPFFPFYPGPGEVMRAPYIWNAWS